MSPIIIESMDQTMALFGLNDLNVRLIEEKLNVRVSLRGNQLHVQGDEANRQVAINVFERMLDYYQNGHPLDITFVHALIDSSLSGKQDNFLINFGDTVAYTYRGRRIFAKTPGQQSYIQAMRSSPLTVAYGPAGTGKTFLAVALAVLALKNREVERLILTRPAVEAGEKLGFLPGDMSQKVDPYLRPLYDSLFEMLGSEGYQKYQDRGMIEVAPLAFMRGRTLQDAFIILDEAQNTSPEQMKMFLTRMGQRSKCVVAGDLTQIDLPNSKLSGLVDALDVLQDIEGVSIVALDKRDVVRNDLVARIVTAYENRR